MIYLLEASAYNSSFPNPSKYSIFLVKFIYFPQLIIYSKIISITLIEQGFWGFGVLGSDWGLIGSDWGLIGV